MNPEEVMLRLDRALPILMHRVFHRTKTLGVGPAAMMVLRRLKYHNNCTVSELAQALGVTSATITGITNKLVAQDFIKRHRDTEDRRVVRLSLTPAGAEVLKKIEAIRQKRLAKVVSGLTLEDQTALADLLEKLIESAAFGHHHQSSHPHSCHANG